MDAYVSRKRRRVSLSIEMPTTASRTEDYDFGGEIESTDLKLAVLSSLYPTQKQEDLLDLLVSCDGSVQTAGDVTQRKKSSVIGLQATLPFCSEGLPLKRQAAMKPLTKKGKALHLYSPSDIANHTPCSIVHNFLPTDLANDLLRELIPETATFESISFKLFDNVVKSPHTASFYVDNLAEQEQQKNDFLYNGSKLDDVREILPVMRQVKDLVKQAVNEEIATRIRDHYPHGRKLKHQTTQEWQPNAAFVNCYDGGAQSVGYHTDQLTYLGPRAVIGSLSLGVAREFRVRKIVVKEEDDRGEAADASGQIAIHLPHNSLLVMHAEMQEEWKHSIAPAQNIDPHPIAGRKRINITYRWYRDEFHPRYTPKCKCGVPTVLKSVQRQKQNWGRYMWMCQTQGRPGMDNGCGYFEWAEFTEDGDPIWKARRTQSSSRQDISLNTQKQ